MAGMGKHISTLSPEETTRFFKIFLADQFIYALTSPAVKLSIVLFYRKIFAVRKFRIAANYLIGTCVAWGTATFLSAALQCMPLAKFWDPSVNGYCFNRAKFVLGIQGVNIFLDIVILCMPMPMVWRLQRPWQDKLALSGVFLLGGL